MDLARRLAGEGKAVVLVLHDLCLALRCADKVAVLHNGRLQAFGTPEAVYDSGVLQRVFDVTVHRARTGKGWRYYYD